MGYLIRKPGDLVLETSGHYMTPDPLVPYEVGTFRQTTHGPQNAPETLDRQLEGKGVTNLHVEAKADNFGVTSNLASRGSPRRYPVGRQEALQLVHGQKGAPLVKPTASGGAAMDDVPTPDCAAAPIQLE